MASNLEREYAGLIASQANERNALFESVLILMAQGAPERRIRRVAARLGHVAGLMQHVINEAYKAERKPFKVFVTKRGEDYKASAPNTIWDSRKSSESALGAWLMSNAKELGVEIVFEGM